MSRFSISKVFVLAAALLAGGFVQVHAATDVPAFTGIVSADDKTALIVLVTAAVALGFAIASFKKGLRWVLSMMK